MMVLHIFDWLLFIILLPCVGYMLFYSIASLFYHEPDSPDSVEQKKFLVLFPAYAEDSVIVSSVQTFLNQDYPKELFDVVVISDHQRQETIDRLHQFPITTLIATYENSTKAKALILAIGAMNNDYETVVIMDADNLAPENLLTKLNQYRAKGIKAIQVHRKGQLTQSPISILDGVSEEINNGIFRKGHQAMGISSALCGSGMAFDYQWFQKNIVFAKTTGEDKELEKMLLKQRIPIVYLDKLSILDKKTEKQTDIRNQRRRWIAAHFHSMLSVVSDLPQAVSSLNFGYTDKIFQWMLPPRLIQLAFVFGITLFVLIFGGHYAYKWLYLSLAQIIALLLPVPKSYWNTALFKSLIKLPMLTIQMFSNLFHLKKANEHFIHTKHE